MGSLSVATYEVTTSNEPLQIAMEIFKQYAF